MHTPIVRDGSVIYADAGIQPHLATVIEGMESQVDEMLSIVNAHAKLVADRDALLEALKPFAKIAAVMPNVPRGLDNQLHTWEYSRGSATLYHSDLIAAQKAIAAAEKEDGNA